MMQEQEMTQIEKDFITNCSIYLVERYGGFTPPKTPPKRLTEEEELATRGKRTTKVRTMLTAFRRYLHQEDILIGGPFHEYLVGKMDCLAGGDGVPPRES